MIGDFLTCGM